MSLGFCSSSIITGRQCHISINRHENCNSNSFYQLICLSCEDGLYLSILCWILNTSKHCLAPSRCEISVCFFFCFCFEWINHSGTTEKFTYSFLLIFIGRNRSSMHTLCLYKFYILLKIFCFISFGVFGLPVNLTYYLCIWFFIDIFLDFKMKSENPCIYFT